MGYAKTMNEKWYNAPVWWLVSGALLYRLLAPKPQQLFRCVYCGFTAPDSEEYTCANPQGIRQRGMCKSCMFKYGAGRLPVIMSEYCGAGSGNQIG